MTNINIASGFTNTFPLLEVSALLVYFSIMILIGVVVSRKIKKFHDFAIGNRNLPTSVIGMTMCATLIGGGSAMGAATEAYKYGIMFILARYGEAIGYLIVAYFIAPKMERFYGMTSVGDIMAKLYGKKFGILTGICGLLLCVGRVSAQVMALGFVVEFLFGYSQFVGIISGVTIITIYSLLGGIRAVILTDVIQFILMFGTVPIILNKAMISIGGYSSLITQLPHSHLTLDSNDLLKYITIFIYMSIPILGPPYVQRILICKNVDQTKKSFMILALGDFLFATLAGVIGLAAYILYKSAQPNTVYLMVMSEANTFIRTVGVVGLFAIIMSTADSFINSGSICFVHDVLGSYKMKDSKKLFYARIATLIIAILATLLALTFDHLFQAAVYSSNFWGPIVVGPLLVGIMGYTLTSNQCIYTMIAGFSAFLLWEYFEMKSVTDIYSVFVAIFVNILLSILFIVRQKVSNR